MAVPGITLFHVKSHLQASAAPGPAWQRCCQTASMLAQPARKPARPKRCCLLHHHSFLPKPTPWRPQKFRTMVGEEQPGARRRAAAKRRAAAMRATDSSSSDSEDEEEPAGGCEAPPPPARHIDKQARTQDDAAEAAAAQAQASSGDVDTGSGACKDDLLVGALAKQVEMQSQLQRQLEVRTQALPGPSSRVLLLLLVHNTVTGLPPCPPAASTSLAAAAAWRRLTITSLAPLATNQQAQRALQEQLEEHSRFIEQLLRSEGPVPTKQPVRPAGSAAAGAPANGRAASRAHKQSASSRTRTTVPLVLPVVAAAAPGMPRTGSTPELAAAVPCFQLPPLQLHVPPVPAAVDLRRWQALLPAQPTDGLSSTLQGCVPQLPAASGTSGISAASAFAACGVSALPAHKAPAHQQAGPEYADPDPRLDSGTLSAEAWDWLVDDCGERLAGKPREAACWRWLAGSGLPVPVPPLPAHSLPPG